MRPHAPPGRRSGPVSARAARVLYNVADACLGGEAAVDVLPGVEQRIRWRGVGAARRAWLLLMAIEWGPVVTLRARRTFSQLPRARRRELLEAWERGRPGARRRALAELRGWIAEAADQSSGA